MNKLTLAVGTTSKLKLTFLNEILNEIGIPYELFPTKTISGVPDQPITEKDTLTGSINRAREALDKSQEAEAGLGIEVGYEKDKNGKYEMFCYATIVSKDDYLISCCSHKFLLPKFYQEVLKNNYEMHEHVEKYYKKDSHPATQFLAKMIDERKPFIIEALRSVILRYLKREEF